MRLAWFSPLPPAGSGIAAYSAELLPLLAGQFTIDCYVPPSPAAAGFGATSSPSSPAAADVGATSPPSSSADAGFGVASAHDFVWRHRRTPYDLTVFQLGNAAWHDYMWAYAVNYPGLVILHDARLHHARARHLLRAGRSDDYRREFRYDHPNAPAGLVEYAVEGLGGPIYYLWRMVAALARVSRGVAVHNGRVADDLRAELPGTRIDTVRMGVPPINVDAPAADARRQLHIAADAVVFAAFGKITAEKRIRPILTALAAISRGQAPAHLLLIGDASGDPSLADEIAAAGLSSQVTIAGTVADADLPRVLAAADACLCLRWPTAEETSASWLRCLAAGKATVISDLPHLGDVPTLLARSWRPSHAGQAPVAVAIDLLEEEATLRAAMTKLASDAPLRDTIAAAGRAYWNAHHRLDLMADDYRALIRDVASRPAPSIGDLPFHFTDDYSTTARDIAAQFGVDLDILPRR